MLFHVWIIISIISSISCDISCYDCSSTPQRYNYIITPDRIPTEIQNCNVAANNTRCHIFIRWDLTSNSSRISLVPASTGALSGQHTLRTNALLTGIGVVQQIQNSLFYYCSTDRCNDIVVLKRLLESLSLKNELTKLDDLLQPTSPFDGHWCLLANNQTDGYCPSPSSVDPNTCKQCSTNVTTVGNTDLICATCLPDVQRQNSLGEEVLFNMTDRSRTANWYIYCQSSNCSTTNTGPRIQQNSQMSFDFDHFFPKNTAYQQTMSSILFAMLFFVYSSSY